MTNPYQVDRNQVEHEARAKIFWGDSPEEVVHFMRVRGFTEEEACEFVDGVFEERAATIRGMGVKKILLGCVLVALPIVGYFTFASITAVMVRVVGALAVGGLWGLWLIIKGIMMMMSPRTEPGDVADQ